MTKYYTKNHEWIEIDGEIGTVGISDYAKDQLGDVVYAELPEVGKVLGLDAAAVVESVKAASDVYNPKPGIVTEVNAEAKDNPGQLTWLYKIKLTSSDTSTLLDESQYKKLIS
jgi:glycine cleavage system H protein